MKLKQKPKQTLIQHYDKLAFDCSMLLLDCGTGKGGFKGKNTCAKGHGSAKSVAQLSKRRDEVKKLIKQKKASGDTKGDGDEEESEYASRKHDEEEV